MYLYWVILCIELNSNNIMFMFLECVLVEGKIVFFPYLSDILCCRVERSLIVFIHSPLQRNTSKKISLWNDKKYAIQCEINRLYSIKAQCRVKFKLKNNFYFFFVEIHTPGIILAWGPKSNCLERDNAPQKLIKINTGKK